MVCSSSNLRRSTGYCYWLSPGDLCLLLLGHHRFAAIWYRMIWDETGRRYSTDKQATGQHPNIFICWNRGPNSCFFFFSYLSFLQNPSQLYLGFSIWRRRRRSGCSAGGIPGPCAPSMSPGYSLIIILWVALKWLRDNGLVGPNRASCRIVIRISTPVTIIVNRTSLKGIFCQFCHHSERDRPGCTRSVAINNDGLKLRADFYRDSIRSQQQLRKFSAFCPLPGPSTVCVAH